MSIKPGETDTQKLTIYFDGWTKEGLLASGNGSGDPDYEGDAYPATSMAGLTLTYEHDINGDVAANGVLTVVNGRLAYTFDAATEADITKADSYIAIKLDGGDDFRRQVLRVRCGKSIQPGELDTVKRRVWVGPFFTIDGALANGGTNVYYEGALYSDATITYAHNLGSFTPAGGTLHKWNSDEWYYDPVDAETASMVKGTIAYAFEATGFRPVTTRVNYGIDDGSGDSTTPTITVVSPTPGVAPGSMGGFPNDLTAARATPIVIDIGDLDPGLKYTAIIARFYSAAEGANPSEEVVYRRGQFRGKYVNGSSFQPKTDINGMRMTMARDGGWPLDTSTNSIPYIAFAVDAVDGAGNLA